jgi:hypothetical protein
MTAGAAGSLSGGVGRNLLIHIQMKGIPIMNFTPQVETAEISDSDLDGISGGLQSAVVSGVVGNATSTLDGIAPVSGIVGTAVGTVESATGLNTGAVTGLVAGL